MGTREKRNEVVGSREKYDGVGPEGKRNESVGSGGNMMTRGKEKNKMNDGAGSKGMKARGLQEKYDCAGSKKNKIINFAVECVGYGQTHNDQPIFESRKYITDIF